MRFKLPVPKYDVVYGSAGALFLFDIMKAFRNFADHFSCWKIDECGYAYTDGKYLRLIRFLHFMDEFFRQLACFVGGRAYKKFQKNPEFFTRPHL